MEKIEGKFDYIVGNPPYDGVKQLHQHIFNISVDLLKTGGEITFIQPAYPYQYNKPIDFKHNLKMVENLTTYETEAEIVPGSIFEEVKIITDLAITRLKKVKNNTNKIKKITYKNGKVYYDVSIEDISITGIDPKIFRSIRNKYIDIVNKNGSLLDIVKLKPNSTDYISVAQLRGNIDKSGVYKSDFYTLFSPNDRKKTENIEYGLQCIDGQRDNMYSYLESKVARFGLAIRKLNNHNNRGELGMIPIVDFSRTYTDSELFNMLGLNKYEIAAIEDVIVPHNHG